MKAPTTDKKKPSHLLEQAEGVVPTYEEKNAMSIPQSTNTVEVHSTTGTAPIRFTHTGDGKVRIDLEDGSSQVYAFADLDAAIQPWYAPERDGITDLERDGIDGSRQLDGSFRRYVPTRECEPWCRDGDGHPKETHPHDRVCRAEAGLLHWRRSHDYDLEITAQLVGDPGQAPTVALWLEGRFRGEPLDVDPELTPAEARLLAEALTRAADMIEDGAR